MHGRIHGDKGNTHELNFFSLWGGSLAVKFLLASSIRDLDFAWKFWNPSKFRPSRLGPVRSFTRWNLRNIGNFSFLKLQFGQILSRNSNFGPNSVRFCYKIHFFSLLSEISPKSTGMAEYRASQSGLVNYPKQNPNLVALANARASFLLLLNF
jgi:hypothetical protein